MTSTQRSILTTFNRLLLAIFAMSIPGQAAQAQSDAETAAAADDQLGSTMTLDQLKARKPRRRRTEPDQPLTVEPAAEPVPALSIRLYPARWELRPGRAELHFTRAMMFFMENPEEARRKWQSNEWLSGTGDGVKPTREDLQAVVDGLKPLYDEVHALALSEDFTWDHRIRDIRGPEVYMYMLPDVQQVRTLARMLVLKVRYQLMNKDFDGALASISDGLRLAQFVGQGETLIQKLVGIAVASMMREQLKAAISTPGCPNLYWAIATLPRPLIDVSESVLWELSNVANVLPVLKEAETANWTEEEAGRRWASAMDDLDILAGSGAANNDDFRVALAISSVAFVEKSRQKLRDAGYSKDRLDGMPGLQIVLIHASRELRRVGDDLGKAYLLPTHQARPLFEAQDKAFRAWLSDNKMTSVAAAIGGLLYPAVKQAKEAETRLAMTYNRLMTLEAIRLYAATHNGAVPESLDQLTKTPALPDAYTGEPFGYNVEQIEGGVQVTLTAAGPATYKPLQTVSARIMKP